MNSEAVKALDDDKDNDEFESWNWQKLVNGKTVPGALRESATKDEASSKTPATAPKPTLVRKTRRRRRRRRELESADERDAQSGANPQRKRPKLAKISGGHRRANGGARGQESGGKAGERRRRAPSSTPAAPRRRRNSRRESVEADEETAAVRARYDAQRARASKRSARTNEEKQAELEAFRSREAPSVKATIPSRRETSGQEEYELRRETSGQEE